MRKSLTEVIKKKREIRGILAGGEKRRGKYLLAFVQASKGEQFRFCVLVGGKVKRAVDRNRIKRLLREIIRKNRSLVGNRGDVVLSYSPGWAEVTYHELEADFRNLFL